MAEIKATSSALLSGTPRLLHPFMPFLTGELNQKIFASERMLISVTCPKPTSVVNERVIHDVHFVVKLNAEIRYICAEINVPLSAKPVLQNSNANAAQKSIIQS